MAEPAPGSLPRPPRRPSRTDRGVSGSARLDALAYRLKLDAGPGTHVLPAPPVKPVGEAPQRALPLGPVVVARKPRRR